MCRILLFTNDNSLLFGCFLEQSVVKLQAGGPQTGGILGGASAAIFRVEALLLHQITQP